MKSIFLFLTALVVAFSLNFPPAVDVCRKNLVLANEIPQLYATAINKNLPLSAHAQSFSDVADTKSNGRLDYAYIGSSGAKLLDDDGSVITSLPATYFVTVTGENEQYYLASYLDLEGFVEKTSVEIVDYEPVTKYASPTFITNNDTHPVNLRSSPHADAPIITVIPDASSGIYYGTVPGDDIVAGISTWYFVRYGQSYHGYVYSTQISPQPITANIIEKVVKKDEEKEQSIKPDALEGIFIGTLCVPAVIIMLLIFRGGEKRKSRYGD
ncbi:MAG: SH3 domain-containing protein [Clostridia bacterium]|nr:SH3 domain-containing protein [Clostridia bacterium]